jgi:hypothetical protein
MSYNEIQMEEMHDDEMTTAEKLRENNDGEMNMKVSSNGNVESNTEDSMDVDEIQLEEDMCTFLTDEKR